MSWLDPFIGSDKPARDRAWQGAALIFGLLALAALLSQIEMGEAALLAVGAAAGVAREVFGAGRAALRESRRASAPEEPLPREQTHLPREATGAHRLPREHTGQRELERNEDAIPTVRERVDPPTPARPLGTWRDHDPDKTPSETPASKRRDRGTDT